MHAFLHKSRRENHRRVVFTQQETIYLRAHLVLTNLLITSLLVLCFSQWFLLFLPPKFILISCRPIDSYSDICYLGTDELIIFVSFLWMIWVDLPFLIQVVHPTLAKRGEYASAYGAELRSPSSRLPQYKRLAALGHYCVYNSIFVATMMHFLEGGCRTLRRHCMSLSWGVFCIPQPSSRFCRNKSICKFCIYHI